METESDQTTGSGNSRRRGREQSGNDDPAGWPAGHRGPRTPGGAHAGPRRGGPGAAGLLDTGPDGQERSDGYRGRHSQAAAPARGQRPASEPWPPGDDGGQGNGARGPGAWDGGARDDGARRDAWGAGAGPYRREDAPVARRTPTGWRVGDEEVSDLTSAMVLADLLAAELPAEGPPTPGSPAASGRRDEAEQPDARQLQETVAQLEHALTVRVRVEQAIGVLAERHRLRPRQAFELLRSAARSRGRRVLEVAGEVVDSASNPLLRLPEELAKPPVIRRGRRMPRRPHVDE
ncbi:MAG TPA: ANTAR domain-containing protein [Streptosporangiaceae bacterium]|nr:ANTAR domain-containing protein [Streptosporangiaceae bacterium]